MAEQARQVAAKARIQVREDNLASHAAVRPWAGFEQKPAREASPTRGRDMSQATVRATAPLVGRDYAASTCPLAPTRCPYGGACHACPARVQRKMAISEPDDIHEQKANRVAGQILQLPAPQVQRRAASQNASTVAPPIVHEVLRSPGQALDAETRAYMEPRFGYDFRGMRVHTDARAAESARAVDAAAYTVGGDIVFAGGQYAMGTSQGRLLLAHELTHVLQQQGHVRLVQRTPSSAAEGAAQTGEANPPWQFGRTRVGRGFRMNPALWRVTYHLQTAVGNRAISNDSGHTALDNVQNHLRRHPAWRSGAALERIEVELLDGVRASVAAQDLMARTARQRYSFECFTAAALVQFAGVYRGLQTADATTADVTFDRSYGDFRVTIPLSGDPSVRMGGSMLAFNLANRPEFSLRELRDDPADRGLERGDWVYLSNASFIASGAFQGENATYLGGKRFFGHGLGVFTIEQYAERLRRRHRVRLSVDEILNQVRVGPRYRAPNSAAGTSVPTPTP